SRSVNLVESGATICRKASRLAWIQPGRSTTRTGAVGPGTRSSVTSATYASARTAASRSAATADIAPAREISGPGFTSRRAVCDATFQSTIVVAMPRLYARGGRDGMRGLGEWPRWGPVSEVGVGALRRLGARTVACTSTGSVPGDGLGARGRAQGAGTGSGRGDGLRARGRAQGADGVSRNSR